MMTGEHAIVSLKIDILAVIKKLIYTARITCDVNSCSDSCAIVDGTEQCFCPTGLELAPGSTTDCTGRNRILEQANHVTQLSEVETPEEADSYKTFSPCRHQ